VLNRTGLLVKVCKLHNKLECEEIILEEMVASDLCPVCVCVCVCDGELLTFLSTNHAYWELMAFGCQCVEHVYLKLKKEQ
jgi:hypothetical protein